MGIKGYAVWRDSSSNLKTLVSSENPKKWLDGSSRSTVPDRGDRSKIELNGAKKEKIRRVS